MTLPEPSDVIAPRDDLPYDTADFLGEMFANAYPDGVVLAYHGLKLYSRCQHENGVRVYDVYTEDETYIETLNLEAFQTATELQDTTRSSPTIQLTARSG
ncbi:hypothetical protein [Halopiger djelfimassiliensis]|uniref:hypothetical protein n=1 Tax=Halopiger djelfimassiliensis TaxID=1293047 RepID=UPI001E3C7AA9|nr:hypothetical protein [Halopiger djelfimassiliensis]